jgi:hypothetical protein
LIKLASTLKTVEAATTGNGLFVIENAQKESENILGGENVIQIRMVIFYDCFRL